MTEENTEMATVHETPKPEEPPETVEEMKPELKEEHKNETLKLSRVKIREVAKSQHCRPCDIEARLRGFHGRHRYDMG